MAAILPISAWPDTSTKEGRAFFADATMLLGLWRATRGVSNLVTFAMIAQAEAESSFDCNAMGDHEKATGEPTAFGLHQRHADRILVIAKALGIDLRQLVTAKQNSFAIEVLVSFWELTEFPYLGFSAMRNCTTPYGAGYAACWRFERAGADGARERRGQMAARWANFFKENP